MKKIRIMWSSSFIALIVTGLTLVGITSVAYASGGNMFNPGSLNNSTGAPLGGVTSHAGIQECSTCHATPWGTETMTDRCLQCHSDIVAQLKDAASLHSLVNLGTSALNCRDCHTEHHGPTAAVTRIPPGWDPHSQLGFSLKAHRLRMDGTPFECKDCHENGYSAPFDQLTCANCHLKVDPVFSQEHILAFWTDCQACHDGVDSHGKSFNHNQVPFSLVGIHRLTACAQCHTNARSLTDLKGAPQDCFACHQKDDAHAGQFGNKCGICHTAEGWQKSAQFDHELANFKLRGLHTSVACAACHPNHVYKGVPSDCASCHEKDDKHKGTLGTDCAACHTPEGWNRAVDHTKFAFQLEGKHADVACENCHKNAVFKGTPMDCASCHTKDDTHAGSLGNQCGDCHTPKDWTSATFDHNSVSFTLNAHQTKTDGTAFVCKDCHTTGYAMPFNQIACANCHLKIDLPFTTEHILTFWTGCMSCHDGMDSHGSSFNHNLVTFPLQGKHALATCANCHFNDRSITDMKATSQDCYTCHQKDDFHKGAMGTKCATCHSPTGWKPANFDHSKFAFPLQGKHTTAACENCHKNGVFKGTPTDCVSCHLKDDGHAGSLGTQCGTCHVPTGWSPAIFDHNSVAFALTAHKTKSDNSAFACKDCHTKGYTAPFDQTSCSNCHQQIDPVFSTEHFQTFGTDCKACHDGVESHGSTFDHNSVPFFLAGKHGQVTCGKCHINARKLGDLKAAPQDCVSCHLKDDHHNGGFGTNCATCHIPDGWNLAKVDHSKFAFTLVGKHNVVSCETCHKNGVFKGTPTDCVSCHLKDDHHIGALGTSCATCHSPTGWKPSNIDHSKFAFPLQGKHTTTACENCHKNGVFKGTPADCVSCHLKDDGHAGTLGTQCGTCHTPTGWSPASFDHNSVAFALTAHKTKSDNSAFACKDCHTKGYTAPFDQNTCGNCHLQIDQVFATDHFLTFGTDCKACHDGVESHGSSFDHNLVPFILAGKHGQVTCGKCHINARKLGDLKGTAQDCVSCHLKDDHHNGGFGTNCATCHNPEGWSLAKVDHSKFAFHLDGKHAATTCENCHKNGVFKGTPSDCVSCHLKDDGHAGTLGTQCGTCHTPTGWSPVSFNHNSVAFALTAHKTKSDSSAFVCKDCHTKGYTAPFDQNTCGNCHLQIDQVFATDHFLTFGTNCMGCHNGVESLGSTFDHNLVTFMLAGKHGQVTCGKCHINARKLGDLKGTAQDCVSCHLKDDHHNGGFGTNCASCHNPEGWSLAKVDHSKFAFHLDGKHAAVACENCHQNGVFKGTPTNCAACHTKNDPHAGKLGTQCESCHTVTGWTPSTFDHSRSAFLLTGKHMNVVCSQCHTDKAFKGTPTDCASCHTKIDPHGGALGNQCATCHATSGWKPSNFNHANSIFQLTGKHINVICSQCHTDLKFKGTPTNCYSCHAQNDRHGGKYGTSCSACHSPAAWKPATFNHSLSAFPLTGAHTNTECAKCHINNVFAGTPKDCYSCHASKDPHSGKFGTTCSTCHTTTAWKPSTFTHGFPLTHGNSGTVACITCHPAGYQTYTCYGCHEHTQTEIASKHRNIPNFQNCVQCHADGRNH